MDTVYKTFTDRQGRRIKVGMDVSDIVAEHNGNRIATWTFDQREENGLDFLGVAEMDEDYQRSGIGKEMLEAAENYYDDFLIVDHFSLEGAAFFNACKEKGISQKHHGTFINNNY